MEEKVIDNTLLDSEWVELIKEAKELGMSKREVRNFLNKSLEENK
ncbi:anti-repressor SinI family protein [Oceanobacillus halophilus]|nr:anti-repressor SinI family protein [Oceanobacillus halophilus]